MVLVGLLMVDTFTFMSLVRLSLMSKLLVRQVSKLKVVC
jgi:hypothetical protein